MRPARARSLIYDIYGAYLRDLGGWIAIADLITLMADLGVEEQAVRSWVSRMSRRGTLVRESRDGQVGYRLSEEATRILEEGDQAIFSSIEPADLDDGWLLAAFSIPEGDRDQRHKLRAQLGWLGFGNLSSGLWIAPHRVRERTVAAVERLGLTSYVDLFVAHHLAFGDLASLVERCWDLAELAAMYDEIVRAGQPVVERWSTEAGSDREAFVEYTGILHRWRKMPYLDPGLPDELLPAGWQGRVAAELFATLVRLLAKPARRHVEAVVGRRG